MLAYADFVGDAVDCEGCGDEGDVSSADVWAAD